MKRRLRIQAAAMFLGSVAIIGATFTDMSPGAVVLICSGVVSMSLGNWWMSNQHRDTRLALVDVVRDCGMRHGGSERADFFEGRVPADVLAEAFPKPSSPTEEKA